GAPHDVRAAAEVRSPEALPEHRHRGSADTVLVLGELASIEADGAPHDVRAAAEVRSPEALPEHRHRGNLFGFLGLIFGPFLLSIFILLVRVYYDEFVISTTADAPDIPHHDAGHHPHTH
ncbi:MAG TPA: hypothetical protein VLL95_11360, partial [Phnomibacter sp.]|nr:hypothetical protein [Phnomibacter sp.]